METIAWNSAHYQEPFHTQRTAKLPAKLERLGVLSLDRDARILDTCCGRGEALGVLHKRGFRRLYGADSLFQPSWDNTNGTRFVASDVMRLPFNDNQFDAVMNLHAMHHMGDTPGVSKFLNECMRVLRPGGRLFIIDFPGSLQIKLLFAAMRKRLGTVTPNLRNFAEIVDEEWGYLSHYLAVWPSTEALLRGGSLRIERWDRAFFLNYLVLVKPEEKRGPADDHWTRTYSDPRQHARRQQEMRAKLCDLGIDRAPRDAQIFDLCCGMGEALENLSAMGFRNLHGIDLTPYPKMAGREDFDFTVSDVRTLPLPDACADWLLSIHSLHHLENSANVGRFIDECTRVLKPGGKLAIIDFPASPQIKAAFRLFLYRSWQITPYLKWFGSLIQSEWYFLRGYLREWPQTRGLLLNGRLRPLLHKRGFFYYSLVLEKPVGA